MNELLAERSKKYVATWIMIGVAMLIIQVLLGGVTRLTGSGLSITEWNVVTGTIPPLNHNQWLAEFEKYKATPQFQYLNSDFTLHDFKFIFFWEWFHRLWARLIAVVFVVGFLWLLVKKHLRREMILPLLLLFALGAMQGLVGWIMVASGLTGDATYVRPTRLAMHYVFAMVLVCAAFWYALHLLIRSDQKIVYPSLRKLTGWMIAILFVQLAYGALMAGHKAATAAPTWPDINGYFYPPNTFKDKPAAINFIKNIQLIHFIHRGLAYLLFILTITWTWKAFKFYKASAIFRKTRIIPLVLVTIQGGLGIFSVLTSIHIVPNHWGTFEWLAQIHQLTAMFFLLSLVWMLYLVRNKA